MEQMREKNTRKVRLLICFGILFFILLIISLVIHEAGHIISCRFTGQTPQWVNIQQSTCSGNPSLGAETIVKFSGGMFSAFILSLILLLLNKISRLSDYRNLLNISFMTVIIIHLLNAILEASLPIEGYQAIAGNLYIILSLVVTILIVVYLTADRK